MSKHNVSRLLFLSAAVAAANTHAKTEVEHVLVSGVLHKTEAQTALPVTLLTGKELKDRATNTIGDTLANEPGLANASFGPSVGQPVIRGQQGARVTVLQNGTSSADASNNSADHAVSVEPILADSIEVLRGPSTLLYGGGAIGGVVNVIDNRIPTEKADGLTGAGEIRHGSVDDETTAVMKVEGGSGPFAFHLNGIKRDTNDVDIPGYATNPDFDTPEGEKGTIGNTDSDLNAFTFGASFVGDNGFFGLSYSDLSNDYGLPEGSHSHHHHDDEHEHDDEDHHDEDEHEDEDHHDEDEHDEHDEHDGEEGEDIRLDIEQTRYDLRGGLTNLDGLLDEMRVAVTYSDYEHVELEGDEIGTRFSNESVEGRLELVHDEINGFAGALGMQFEDSDFAAIGDEAFIPETNTKSYGIFLVEDLHVNEDVYEFGVRFDRDEYDAEVGNDESFDSISLSAAGHWMMNENWHIGAALTSSERAPVLEELYSNNTNDFGDYVEHVATARIEVGDSNLDNEQANNLDFSVHYHTDSLDVNVSLYYNDFRDYIYLANGNMEQDETDVYFYRQEDAKFYGIEFDATAALGQALGGEFELRVFGDTITGELDSSGDVPRLPPMRIGSEINFIAGPFSSYVAVLNAADQDNPGDFENETDGYTRWDAGMDYRFGDIDAQNALIFLKLKNISDEEIRHSVSALRDQAPEAGRSVVAGVRFSF